MKSILFTLFILGASQGFSQTVRQERVRPTTQTSTTGQRTEAPPATQPAATTPQTAAPAEQSTEKSPGVQPVNTIQPGRKFVAREARPAQKETPAPATPAR